MKVTIVVEMVTAEEVSAMLTEEEKFMATLAVSVTVV